MRVLGVDLSTNTGVGVVDASKTVVHAQDITFPKLKGMDRVNAIVAEILSIRSNWKPHMLCVEDYAVGKFGGSAIVSIEIGAVLRFICWQESIPLLEVSASSLKKFLTGSGKGKKEHMMLELYKRFGYSAANNDIADGVALGFFGQCLYAPGLFTKQQVEAAEAALKHAPPQVLSVLNRCS